MPNNLIRARKKYLLLFVYIVKSIFFQGKLKMVLKTHFQLFGFLEKSKNNSRIETVVSVVYETEFAFSMAFIAFYLACLFVSCLYLLAYFTY